MPLEPGTFMSLHQFYRWCTQFRREKISIILSPFIPVTWSKSIVPIETFLILEVCLISSSLSWLKLIHGQTIHLQRKHIINLFEASSKVYKTVWTFTVRFTCNCLQYFSTQKNRSFTGFYWPTFAYIREKSFPNTFLKVDSSRETQGFFFVLRTWQDKKHFFSGLVTCQKFTILII